MATKRVGIVGAGPGGLSCAMLLASRGMDVTVFEMGETPGGRNAALCKGGYTFDIGPTFLMMKFVLDDIFRLSGKDVDKYLEFRRLEPMYRLNFEGMDFAPTSGRKAMAKEIGRVFPGNSEGLAKFYVSERERYAKLAPCLQKDYVHFSEFFSKRFIKAIPSMMTPEPLFGVLGHYFKEEKLRLCFTFQSKYLGMSPWECPGAFTMIPFVEHEYGIYHVMGGLNRISVAMAKAAEELGCKIRYKSKVKQVLLEGKRAVGLELESGEKVMLDHVVLNADFGYSATRLFPKGALSTYSPEKVRAKKYSCSTFMLYLGVGKRYDAEHHAIYFAKDYRQNIEDIFKNLKLSDDMSFYIQNASVTDPSLAPKGKSAVYVLVPVPNNKSRIDWKKEKGKFAEKVLAAIEARTPMKGISKHIEEQIIFTPDEWENEKHVYLGATFNLAHSLDQMLYFRPHNKFEEVEGCYLVGGGTHPGSGLPTIYESGRITANLILKEAGMKEIEPSPLPPFRKGLE